MKQDNQVKPLVTLKWKENFSSSQQLKKIHHLAESFWAADDSSFDHIR
jgi:hypothetical protein